MQNLFIDTNVYCGFYEGDRARVKVLETLLELIESKKISLIVTSQIKDEFYKNKSLVASRVVKRIRTLREEIQKGSLPACVSDLEKFKDFESARSKLADLCRRFEKEFISHVLDEKSDINKTMEQIFKRIDIAEIDENILKKAERRVFRGMPPGKKGGNNGDEINWEVLLAQPIKELTILTYDADWCDHLDANFIHGYLKKEWATCKGGQVKVKKNLGELINEIKGPRTIKTEIVKLEDEVRKTYENSTEIINTLNLTHGLSKNSAWPDILAFAATSNLFNPYARALRGDAEDSDGPFPAGDSWPQ